VVVIFLTQGEGGSGGVRSRRRGGQEEEEEEEEEGEKVSGCALVFAEVTESNRGCFEAAHGSVPR